LFEALDKKGFLWYPVFTSENGGFLFSYFREIANKSLYWYSEEPWNMTNKTFTIVYRILGFIKKRTREFVAGILLVVMSFVFVSPSFANADTVTNADLPKTDFVSLIVESMQNATAPYGELPEPLPSKPRRTYTIPITAYSSEVGQTDSTPFITASGTTVRDGIVAANFLRIGTKVRIPELFGEKVFTVEDRMNPRYDYRMDIWMAETDDAWQFGIKRAKIEVF